MDNQSEENFINLNYTVKVFSEKNKLLLQEKDSNTWKHYKNSENY